LGNCFLIHKILQINKVQLLVGKTIFSNPFFLMSCYMGTSMIYADYFDAQNNIIVGGLLLWGLYYYLKDKEHLTYLIWGIDIWFKPIPIIFIIIFILHGPRKTFLRNVFFLIISQIPNLLFFLIYPSLIYNFIYNILRFFNICKSLVRVRPENNRDFNVTYACFLCTRDCFYNL